MNDDKLGIPLPNGFKESLNKTFSPKEVEELLFAIENKDTETSVRFNKYKGRKFFDLLNSPIVEHCPIAKYLPSRPSFIADPLFHAGVYYVQESSSMILYQLKDFFEEKPLLILDMCAAPGGKSTILSDIMPNGSILISNEVVPNRASILKENMKKWGVENSIVTNSYPDKWESLGEIMDIVLVDAPCSGEGMFRKDLESRKQWTIDSPYLCYERQKDILNSAYKILKEGGILIYSTCTYNRRENEDILDYIINELGGESLALTKTPQDAEKSKLTNYHAYRFMPHISRGEGLFFAVVRKNKKNKGQSSFIHKGKKKNNEIAGKEVVRYCEALLNIEDLIVLQDVNNEVYGMSKPLYDVYNYLLSKGIKILSKGVEVGVIKGKDIVPTTSLAMSNVFTNQQNIFEVVDVDKSAALMFLRGEPIILPSSIIKGFVLITYKNIPLGFVKNIGNRVNNLYPNNWRIQKPISELIGLDTLF